MLDTLKSTARELRTILDEISILDTKDREAKKALREVAKTGNLDDPKVQRIVSNARITLDLVASRRNYVESATSETAATLIRELRAVDKLWTKAVQARIDQLEARIREANAPFFDGDTRLMLSTLEAVSFPALISARRAHTPDTLPLNQSTKPEDMPDLVKSYVGHVQTHARRLSITIGEAA
jgi:hypothetical protein